MREPPISLTAAIWWIVIGTLFAGACSAGLVTLSWSLIGLIVLCAACEFIDSSLGMGYGTMLTPLLVGLGFDPVQLVPTILISELLSGFSASAFHAEADNVDFSRGSRELRIALLLSLMSLMGVAAGVTLAMNVSRRTLVAVIGVIILSAGVYVLASAHRQHAFSGWKIGTLALVASFNKAVSGGGYGPLMTTGQMIGGIRARGAVAITSFAEGFTCFAGASLFLWHGRVLDVQLWIPVVTGALITVPLSARCVRAMPEKLLKRAVAMVTLLLGAFMIWRGLFA
jgi:uncharacterized membrane protein YfcA